MLAARMHAGWCSIRGALSTVLLHCAHHLYYWDALSTVPHQLPCCPPASTGILPAHWWYSHTAVHPGAGATRVHCMLGGCTAVLVSGHVRTTVVAPSAGELPGMLAGSCTTMVH